MIIAMLVAGKIIVLAFLGALVLALNVHLMVDTLKKDYPSIDPYSWALVFWTLCFTIELPRAGLTLLPTMIGFIPVARAHCRVARKQRSRYPLLRILMESLRNATAPYRWAKTRIFGKFRRGVRNPRK